MTERQSIIFLCHAMYHAKGSQELVKLNIDILALKKQIEPLISALGCNTLDAELITSCQEVLKDTLAGYLPLISKYDTPC